MLLSLETNSAPPAGIPSLIEKLVPPQITGIKEPGQEERGGPTRGRNRSAPPSSPAGSVKSSEELEDF